MTQARILIVDDNEDIRQLVSHLLEGEGYQAVTAVDGEEMLALLPEARPDLILLDVMLPGTDGFEICRQLRADPNMPPIIMLTAKDSEVDRVVGLELGADDYVVKPFGRRELLARIKAVLRRVAVAPVLRGYGTYVFADKRFTPTKMELCDEQQVLIPLSSTESDLLGVFVQHPRMPLSRDRLLDLTKGRSSMPFDRSIDSNISRLRRKLGDNGKQPQIIKTVWGSGYMLACDVKLL